VHVVVSLRQEHVSERSKHSRLVAAKVVREDQV
jgi:hypothetical protein